jgi:hypothetical protein
MNDMYQFNIARNEDNSWRFELGGINLIIEDYVLRDERHWLKNPEKAIAFFNINGNLYGIANKSNDSCHTAEEFYDVMRKQYAYFQ